MLQPTASSSTLSSIPSATQCFLSMHGHGHNISSRSAVWSCSVPRAVSYILAIYPLKDTQSSTLLGGEPARGGTAHECISIAAHSQCHYAVGHFGLRRATVHPLVVRSGYQTACSSIRCQQRQCQHGPCCSELMCTCTTVQVVYCALTFGWPLVGSMHTGSC